MLGALTTLAEKRRVGRRVVSSRRFPGNEGKKEKKRERTGEKSCRGDYFNGAQIRAKINLSSRETLFSFRRGGRNFCERDADPLARFHALHTRPPNAADRHSCHVLCKTHAVFPTGFFGLLPLPETIGAA